LKFLIKADAKPVKLTCKGCVGSFVIMKSWFRFLLKIIVGTLFATSQLHRVWADELDNCTKKYQEPQKTYLESISRASRNNDVDAQYCLAIMYHDGRYVDRDESTAVKWYTEAAQRGHLESQYWLCLMYSDGLGVPQNALEAIYWCKRAAKKDHPGALYALGNLYYSGHGRDKFTDYLNAYIWFSRAEKAGEEGAADMVKFMESQMTELQILEARKLVETGRP
jgi:TPR repeat protein